VKSRQSSTASSVSGEVCYCAKCVADRSINLPSPLVLSSPVLEEPTRALPPTGRHSQSMERHRLNPYPPLHHQSSSLVRFLRCHQAWCLPRDLPMLEPAAQLHWIHRLAVGSHATMHSVHAATLWAYWADAAIGLANSADPWAILEPNTVHMIFNTFGIVLNTKNRSKILKNRKS
jgi:hypothetical protein